MPRNRKLYLHNHAYFLTSRILEGLPLPCTEFIAEMLKSKLTRAAQLYHVTISHALFMSNHFHITIVVDDPTVVDQFMRSFKTESAKAVNNMLGKRKGAVWEEGYDSPIILDLDKLVHQIAYLYTNPQSANLVDKIEQYPGFNTWGMYQSKKHTIKALKLTRNAFVKVPKGFISERFDKDYLSDLKESSLGKLSLSIDPRAAFEAVKALDPQDMDYGQFCALVYKRVREIEAELRSVRKRSVIGAKILRSQSIYKKHTPQKHGKRMICLGSSQSIRKVFIATYRALCQECSYACQKIRAGCRNTFYPAGFLAPGHVRNSNLIPGAFWEMAGE